jgi:hypothetical protein
MASDHCPINLEIAAWSGVGYGLANRSCHTNRKRFRLPRLLRRELI